MRYFRREVFRAVGAVVLALAPTSRAPAFELPTIAASRAAIGPIDSASVSLQRLLVPDADFRPARNPRPGDWLAQHPERGQTFEAFCAGEIYRPGLSRSVIYLRPFGKFPRRDSPALEDLRLYAAAYFQMPVVLLATVETAGGAFAPRINAHTGKRQLLTRKIHEQLRVHIPDDAFCVLGLTMDDLYPDPRWNFVFGEAVPDWRVGVFSFARYDPAFFGGARPRDFRSNQLRESCKVLVHELGHMFGIEHCIWFDCVMNGANNQRELQESVPHACPVCLRKLHHSVGFDPVKRYAELAHFCLRQGWAEDEKWIGRQIAKAAAP
jgi:archaemetzincin